MKAGSKYSTSVPLLSFVMTALVLQATPAKSQKSEERGPSGTIAYYIEVETSEPEVRIEADGEVVGLSPMKVKVFGDRDGTFHHFKKAKYEIRALPAHPGQYVQVKSFSTGGFFVPEDHIPGRIFFDMSSPSYAAGPEPKPKHGSAPGKKPVRRAGSGFFITDDGYLLTAYHLIQGATNLQVKMGGRMLTAALVRKDQAADLAILKVETNSTGLPIGASKHARLGEHIYSVGFPDTELLGEEPKFTEGSISSLAGFQDDWSLFQVSVPMYLGDSGSAVVNSRGVVIAVVVARVPGVELVNYAVKSSRALIVLEDLPDLNLPGSDSDTLLSSEDIAALLTRSSVIVTAE